MEELRSLNIDIDHKPAMEGGFFENLYFSWPRRLFVNWL